MNITELQKAAAEVAEQAKKISDAMMEIVKKDLGTTDDLETWGDITNFNRSIEKIAYVIDLDGHVDLDPDKNIRAALHYTNTKRQSKRLVAIAQMGIIADYYNTFYNKMWTADWSENMKDQQKCFPMWDVLADKITALGSYTQFVPIPAFASHELMMKAYEANKEIFETALKP